jgi:hypothetical protein
MALKATKGLTALTSEMDCDQSADGLPPVTSAVIHSLVILVKFGCLGGISEMPLLTLRG